MKRSKSIASSLWLKDSISNVRLKTIPPAYKWFGLAFVLLRKRLLRRLLPVMTFAIAFGGGLLVVYIGSHLATDLLAGYLIGASAACCAIGLLVHNEAERTQ